MAAIEEARKILAEFGKELADDLEVALNRALKAGGTRKPQNSKIQFGETTFIEGGGVEMHLTATEPYWRYIEHGVDGNKSGRGATQGPEGRVYKYSNKMPKASYFGEAWQKENSIDPRVVLLRIRANSIAKKKGLNVKPRSFKKLKKTLDYKKSASQFSFIVQRSVFNKGLKKREFINPVINDGRIEVLSSTLRQVLGKEYKLEIIAEFT